MDAESHVALGHQNRVKVYELFRSHVVHEDDLIDQRTTWAVTIQGFAIAALGFSVGSSGTNPKHQLTALIITIATIGIGVALISYVSVRAAQLAIRGICEEWEWRKRDRHLDLRDEALPPFIGGGKAHATVLGHAMPLTLQTFFIAFWIVVIFYALFAAPEAPFRLLNGISISSV